MRQGAGARQRRAAGLRAARRGHAQGAAAAAAAGSGGRQSQGGRRRGIRRPGMNSGQNPAMNSSINEGADRGVDPGGPRGAQADPRPDPSVTAADRDPRRAIHRLNMIGLAVVVVLVGGVGGWATTAQLSGAVIAPGTVVVESNVKKVQHPSGGVVGEIFVKEGSPVEAGQVVLRLDDTVTRATLGVVRSQLDEFTAREARLLAERDDADRVVFPAPLQARRSDPSVATALAGEETLFASRRSARTGQRAQLRERIAQTNEEIRGLSAQQTAKEAEIALIGKELVGVTDLYEKNLVSIS